MRRIKTISPARPFASHVVGVLTAKEAAGRLSRLEFDVARLERDIEVAEERISKSRMELKRCVSQRQTLIAIIAKEPGALKEPFSNGT